MPKRKSKTIKQPPPTSYWPLFEHMSHAHGLTLLDSEMEDICQIVEKMEWRKRFRASPKAAKATKINEAARRIEDEKIRHPSGPRQMKAGQVSGMEMFMR